ncbi:MAG TPA: ATP-binding protein [Oligoflexia bacterium]|nr:ATP-binding protein [Oligoflexia bacterium]HMR24758.1 ATP-binding protein [Oligoflexia bacterium]
MIQTNWHIITGAPSSGITSLGNYLRFMGFKVIPEVARGLIDIGNSQNISTHTLREDQVEFERDIVKFQTHIENQLDPKEFIFIERGLLDCAAYGLPLDEINTLSQYRYKHIFFLQSLNFQQDYARIENFEQAKIIGERIQQLYLEANYALTKIKKTPLAKRAQAILEHCKQSSSISLLDIYQ